MATSAQELRGYDTEAMLWTSVPTTGDSNSTVTPKIRSQPLLQAAARRSQDKAQMAAFGAAPAAGSSVGNVNAPATRATGSKDKAFSKWKPRPMPKPTPEDYVIVIKPRESVSLHEAFTETGYGTATSAYLGLKRARAISVLPSREQNLIIVHTPDIEAAGQLIRDFAVNSDNGSIPLRGYLRQDGGNMCHGGIVVRNSDTTETLKDRVCWRAGTILEIRKFGTSNKARITFAGKEKPRYVHYDNMVVSVRNYYKTIPACGQCGVVGHRADACPNLRSNTCGLCGFQAPLVEGVRAPHNCVPRCSLCGGSHATNSRDCAAKFRTPKTKKKKTASKKKSRYLGPPGDQHGQEISNTENTPTGGAAKQPSKVSPPHGGLAKQSTETRGDTRAWVNAVKNGHQVSCSGGAASLSPFSTPFPRAHSAEQDQIAALRAQNEMLLKEINELESKINQSFSPPSPPAAEVMESELVVPKAVTSLEAAFEARLGATEARFAALENQISMMVNAISKLQETIPAMIAQQIANSLRSSRRPGDPLHGRPHKTSRRTLEVADDDNCSLSGMEDTPLPASVGSGAVSVQPLLNPNDHGEQP
ncbi:uncharacterized protein LOC144127672 [Amblyomma americanum]